MDGLSKNNAHLIYLISCALRGADVKESALKGMDLSGLFVLAQKHSVAAMVCMALEQTDLFTQADPAVKKQWLDAKNKAVRKNLLLDIDRELLMDEMEQAGIWHVPLKGSILKDWYPQYGMRQMADNDILFDETYREQVKELFLKHGYCVEHYNQGVHDVYYKQPIYNFEMHITLFHEIQQEKLAEKYADVKKILIPDENKPYRFHFTQEDFYIFVIAHAYKHYSLSGTGIRTLADIYVMNHKIGKSLHWDYVEKELEALGIRDYENRSRILAEKIFGSGKPVSEMALTAEEQEVLLYHLDASTYGTLENRVNNRLHSLQTDAKPISGWTKLRYCVERIFPGRRWCKTSYPFIYRHPWLLPAFWIWRLFARLHANGRRIWRELSTLKSSK